MVEHTNPIKPIKKKIDPIPGTVERVKKIASESTIVIAKLKISF